MGARWWGWTVWSDPSSLTLNSVKAEPSLDSRYCPSATSFGKSSGKSVWDGLSRVSFMDGSGLLRLSFSGHWLLSTIFPLRVFLRVFTILLLLSMLLPLVVVVCSCPTRPDLLLLWNLDRAEMYHVGLCLCCLIRGTRLEG